MIKNNSNYLIDGKYCHLQKVRYALAFSYRLAQLGPFKIEKIQILCKNWAKTAKNTIILTKKKEIAKKCRILYIGSGFL